LELLSSEDHIHRRRRRRHQTNQQLSYRDQLQVELLSRHHNYHPQMNMEVFLEYLLNNNNNNNKITILLRQ
jgi:hypothetical protein